MILQRLIMNDFRQFYKNNRMDFSPIGDKHVNIVFASNGVGKTTILTAIVWCLYGGKKLPYGDLREEFINKRNFEKLNERDESKVEIILTFEDRDKKYVVTRSVMVSKVNGKQVNSDFNVEVSIDNVTQHYAQDRIDAVLGSAMKEYFFFDGEGIGRLADSSRPELIQKGIKNVMKIDTRKSAFDLIKESKKLFDKESTKIQQTSGITDIPEERIDRLEDEWEIANKKLDEVKEDRDTYERLLQETDKELANIKDIKQEANKKKRLEDELLETKKDLELAINEQKELVTKQAYLALSKDSLQNISSILEEKQKRGELPLLGVTKHFIEELLESHRCICGEEFTDGDSHHQELLEIINRATVKSDIESNLSILGTFVETHKSKHKEFLKLLKNSIKKKEKLQKKYNKLEQNIDAILDEIEKGLIDNETNLATQQKKYKQDIEEHIKQIGKIEVTIETIAKDLDKAKKDLDVSQFISDEVKLIRDRIQYCEIAMKMLDEKNKKEIESIRQELSSRLEERFDTVLHSEKKAILDESFRLTIVGKDGLPSAKSRGEDKLISLIFISTLIDLAREKEQNREDDNLSAGAGIYPIVVDSPYGEFDTVYKKTISKALQTLAPQVIILLSQEQWSEDIEGVFEDSLAHVYRLVAHRPKLSQIQNERNRLYFSGQTFDLEVQDDMEYTTIERLGVSNESV